MTVEVYFGVPGSGKTTFAAYIAKKNHRKKIKTYCNFPCKYTYYYNSSDLGFFEISNADLIIDEAAIDFNNRSYRNLPRETIQYLKLARHYNIGRILIFSQSFDDMDVTLRRLSTEYYLVRKLGKFIVSVKQAVKEIDIDKETHQFYDKYRWRLKMPKFIFAPLYWNMFDSWDAPKLNVKQFPYNDGKGSRAKKNKKGIG